jgi:Tol biopolymer transport system component
VKSRFAAYAAIFLLRGNMKTLICSFALLSFAFTAWAAHPFHVEDMQRLSRLGVPRVSPDGKWVAFTVTRSDVEKNRSVTNIWRIPAAGGDPQQITFGEQGFNGDLRWSPDGRYLYFVSTRVDNKRQILRLPVNGGEAKQVTTVPTGVGAYVLSPDGKTIAITASVFPSCTDMACNEKMAKERTDNPVKTRVITEIPFRRWDTWVDGLRNHIFLVPAEGGAAKDVTPGDADSPIWTEEGTQEVAFSPDSREICFSRFVENEALTGNSDLFVMPTSGGAPKAITTNKATDSTPLYSPDGRYIAYSATLRPMQESDLTRLFLYDRMTGEHKNVFEATDRSIHSYVWAPDSKSLYVTFEDRGQEPRRSSTARTGSAERPCWPSPRSTIPCPAVRDRGAAGGEAAVRLLVTKPAAATAGTMVAPLPART